MARISFLWLELTGFCQLECDHCYAGSGPSGTHGSMTRADWLRVIDQAAAAGVGMVQFIGGEPTLHPDLRELIAHALAAGLEVEVFTNLVHVTAPLWEMFTRPGVSLATSYYSDDPDQHAQVTRRPSHARTRANIAAALRRGIPLRAGVIDMGGDQRATQAQTELVDLGVPAVGYDRLRQVGRGVRDQAPSTDQLCGNCGDGVAAISPDGAVWPCVFSRWLPVGNVLEHELTEILDSPAADAVRAELAAAFAGRAPSACKPDCAPKNQPCNPDCTPSCNPHCQPTCSPRCSPTCDPVRCKPNSCWPRY
ncbi:radical SAM/SPASM domain-containing protein [Alloactinosynnema sp. L-07]|uniref:radical SAM/SPASM domain-containing protein n=1 Tax=Alloactinosynnema sp. L-07 TaxID=1653480 RepID=UPI0012F96A33|nr:radical SAM protein [Alloactinosynnema sp. L-07]